MLGGRATSTSRGQSLTSFIKNGKQSAKIAIKLCNYSPSKKKTFKYADYGKSIIVERIIKSDNTSNYILKSSYSKIISRKKEELNEIINLFSIQIENPVCILSQEVSRNFLNSKNPRDKYTFFMKATNLEQLRAAYALALQQSTHAKEMLSKKKSFLPGVEKEVKYLEKKIDIFTKFNKKRDQLKYLLCELVWSMVNELDKEEQGPPKAINDLDKKIEDCKERYEIDKEENSKIELVRNEFEKTIQPEFENEMKQLNEIKGNLAKRLEELRRVRCEKSLKINELNFSVSHSKKDKQQLSKKIEDIKEQIAQQEKLIAEQEIMNAKKIELQNEQDEIKKANEQLRKDKESKQEEYTKAGDSIKSISYRSEKLRSDLSNKNNLLQNLKGNVKDSLAKFGSQFVRIVKLIEDENRKGKFLKKPIGPLGYYIKLKDDHVSTALESCLKGLMFAFVCDNFQDADHLAKLLRTVKFQQMPLILKRKFGARFQIHNEVSLSKYRSFLSYVTIENDQVFNILMDKSNLDQTLYIPNDSTAVELLTNESNVPSNLKVAYSAVGTQFYPKKANSNFRQYGNNRKASGILTSDTSALVKQIEEQVIDLNESVKQLVSEKVGLERTMRTLNGELKELGRQIDKNHDKLNNISRQFYELSSVKEFKPEDLSIFEQDYQQCIDAMKRLEENLKTLKDDIKDIEEKIKIVKNDEVLNSQEIEEAKDKFEDLKKKARDKEFIYQKNILNMAKIEKRVEEFNLRKEEQMKELTEITLRKEEAIERAKKDHEERIETERKPDEIQKEIDELHEFLKENENRLGNREEVFESYCEKKAHYEKIKDQVEFLERYINEFSESIRMRAMIYIKLRNEITRVTSNNFGKNLKMLNFTGSLEIYHKETVVDGKIKRDQTLDININPKSSDPTKLYKDTRSLSGGERSFSTIAFLIALWESSYSPFNILDEVDVFMDHLTRQMALDSILNSANKRKGKQYIFLSPLRPEKKPIQNLLKIFYMPEPKRVDQAN